jgi:hypothetical protein
VDVKECIIRCALVYEKDHSAVGKNDELVMHHTVFIIAEGGRD